MTYAAIIRRSHWGKFLVTFVCLFISYSLKFNLKTTSIIELESKTNISYIYCGKCHKSWYTVYYSTSEFRFNACYCKQRLFGNVKHARCINIFILKYFARKKIKGKGHCQRGKFINWHIFIYIYPLRNLHSSRKIENPPHFYLRCLMKLTILKNILLFFSSPVD